MIIIPPTYSKKQQGSLYGLIKFRCIRDPLYSRGDCILIVATQCFFYRQDIAESVHDECKLVEGKRMQTTKVMLSIGMFTIRFVMLREWTVLLVPLILTWVLNEYKVNVKSVFRSLFPTYYASMLMVLNAGWNLMLLRRGEGGSWHVVVENVAFIVIMFIFSHYLVTATCYLKNKIAHLEETRKQLEQAISARNTFLAHISHEFR